MVSVNLRKKSLAALLLCAPFFLSACGKDKGAKAPGGSQAPEAAAPAAPAPTEAGVPPRADTPLAPSDPLSVATLQQAMAGLEEVLKANTELLKKGQLDDPAAEILRFLGPVESAPAANILVAGNVLYQFAPGESYRLHMKALEKEPGSLLANLEAAYEYQRAGQYAEACPLWGKVLAREPDRRTAAVMRAHCLLAAGDVSGALAAWPQFRGEDHHALEEAASELFGPVHPLATRKKLLDEASAAAEPDDAVCRLIVHDLNWQTDWWNSRANVTQASVDLEKFKDKLSQNARLPLELLVRMYRAAREEGGSPAQDDVKRLRTLLSKYPARVKSPVLRQLVALADEKKLFSKAEMLAWLGPVLQDRLASAAGSADDGILLASLADGVDNALMERADAQCAERFDHKNCVVSTLISRRMADKLKLEDPLLQKTLKAHPDWVHPHMLAMELTPKGGPEERDMLRRVILAEFHGLEMGSPIHGPHNATGLMSFFRGLRELNK